MRRAQKRKASNTGGLTIQWWAMRDVRVRLAPPASASSLRSSRAALENASRFLSFAPCRVRIPLRWAQKRKAPIAGSLSNQWWAMRDSNPQPCACKAPALTVAPRALMNGECNSNTGNSDLISSLHDVKYYHARASRTTQDQVRC